jgi:hypothetical protein
LWLDWLAAADDSLIAGRITEQAASRSAASRYYYASYQAATAILLYLGLTPPGVQADGEMRGAWNHALTPVLLESSVERVGANATARRELRRKIALLYKVRIKADYHPAERIERIDEIRRSAEGVVKYAHRVIDDGRSQNTERR